MSGSETILSVFIISLISFFAFVVPTFLITLRTTSGAKDMRWIVSLSGLFWIVVLTIDGTGWRGIIPQIAGVLGGFVGCAVGNVVRRRRSFRMKLS